MLRGELKLTMPLGPQSWSISSGTLVHRTAYVVLSPQALMMDAAYSASSYVESINIFTLSPGVVGVVDAFLALRIGYGARSWSTMRGMSGLNQPPRLGACAAPRGKSILGVYGAGWMEIGSSFFCFFF